MGVRVLGFQNRQWLAAAGAEVEGQLCAVVAAVGEAQSVCMACTSVEKIRASLGLCRPVLGGPAGPHQVRIEQGFGHSAACQGGGVPVGGAWPFTRLDFPGRPARNACSRALCDIPSRELFQLWCTC